VAKIRIPSEFNELIDLLSQSSNPNKKLAIFRSNKDVMVFAGALGAHLMQKKPFTDSYKEIEYERIFKDHEQNFLNLVALADTKDVMILERKIEGSDEDKFRIFEGYAYGGLREMRKYVDRFEDTLTAMVMLIKDHQESESEEEDVDISDDIDDLF